MTYNKRHQNNLALVVTYLVVALLLIINLNSFSHSLQVDALVSGTSNNTQSGSTINNMIPSTRTEHILVRLKIVEIILNRWQLYPIDYQILILAKYSLKSSVLLSIPKMVNGMLCEYWTLCYIVPRLIQKCIRLLVCATTLSRFCTF